MRQTLSELRSYLERIGTLETDTPEERRAKATLLVLSGICFFASIVWGTMYFVILGPTITVFITYGFTAVIGVALLVFVATKRFALLLYPFFVMILWNPIAMQWSLGGFAASGVLMTWSILAPFCALMFQTVRAAVWWFAAYLVLLAVSLFLDQQFQTLVPQLSQQTSMLFFGMNIVGPAVAIFLSMMYFVNAYQREHERSESLLLNILPKEIVPVLKSGQETVADHYETCSILFCDMVGSTPIFADLAPAEVVDWLNEAFTMFDGLVEKYGVEKIRTIGDNYMIAAGVPTPRADHATAITALALDIVLGLKQLPDRNGKRLEFRLGINSGPIIAGIIGKAKFQYDLWGDTVNVAARMEQHGEVGKVHISAATYELIKDAFECDHRGMISVKGKEKMETWFVVGSKNP
jgi:guanylate cyclase